MGYFNRFLLFLYALAIALASLGLAVLCLHLLPRSVIENEMTFLLSRWETLVGTAIAFFWSVHLMGCSLSSGKNAGDAEALVLRGAGGEVRVAVSAVRDMVEKSTMMISGVFRAQAEVSARRQGEASAVEIALRVSVEEKENVAALSDTIRAEVRQRVTEILGLREFTLDVTVMEIQPTAKVNKRVN